MSVLDFIMNSDYPTDKIVWQWSGEGATIDDLGNMNTITINHNIGADLFVSGLWSPDNWASTYTLGQQTSAGQYSDRNAYTEANSSVVAVNAWAYPNTGSIKFLLWGVVDDETNVVINQIPQGIFNTVLNSDYSLPKLYMSGYTELANDDNGRGTIINHNLGFVPQVSISRFYAYSSMWSQLTPVGLDPLGGLGGGVFSTGATTVDENQLKIVDYYGKTYYRIYADEA